MRTSVLLLILAIFSVASASASDYDNCIQASAGIDPKLVSCADQELARQNVTINKNYNALKSRIKSSSNVDALKMSEIAWMKYRDDNCNFVRSIHGDTSISKIMYRECLIEMTKKRAKELADYTEDPESD